MILRTTAWDGPAPAAGDVVQLPDGEVAVVRSVAQGPGIGQWRMDADPARLIRWIVQSAQRDAAAPDERQPLGCAIGQRTCYQPEQSARALVPQPFRFAGMPVLLDERIDPATFRWVDCDPLDGRT